MRTVDTSEIRYTHAGDVDIAWTVTGSGPADIVYVPGFISHLDLARELPVFDAVIGRPGRLGGRWRSTSVEEAYQAAILDLAALPSGRTTSA